LQAIPIASYLVCEGLSKKFIDFFICIFTMSLVINCKEYLQQRRNIYIVGFMGVGKTTVARRVAYKLNMTLVDSDRAIERLAGKSVGEIFNEEDGERRFRHLERQFVESGHSKMNCVVACGGGLPIGEGMMELLKSQGVVIALFAGSRTILERTDRRETRPLLRVENKEECIVGLLDARENVYQKAHYLIFSENRRIGDVVADVIRVYNSSQK